MNAKPPLQRRTAGEPHDKAHAHEPRLCLSALADGDAEAAHEACALWRVDADARRTWHTYHLIGDVLRCEELARAPARDAAFLDGLRSRLAQEPVVLAPVLASASWVQRPRAARWLVPMAAAAGFVAVAGVLVVVRMNGADGAPGASSLAAATQPGVTLVSGDAKQTMATPSGAEAVLIRDPRLDEFLRAHQAARNGVAVAAPGGTLRRVDAAMPVGAAQ